MRFAIALALAAALSACGSARERAPAPPESSPPATTPAASEPVPGAVPAEPQRPGDPARGFERLLGEGYVGCGSPRSLYDRFGGTVPDSVKVPGRTGAGAALPYYLNAYTDADGVELVSANCLGCHAGYLRGELVVGLGDTRVDFTHDMAAPLGMAALTVRDPAERRAFDKLAGRVRALAPYIKTRTIGANPADVIASVLFAHRDPETLAWRDEPYMELPAADHPPVPLDTPAWWLARKKNALYYTGAGRGDHARLMMTVSVLCVDDVATAEAIDAYFPDIRAYILSLEPPAYPEQIDAELAARGRPLFEKRCSRCHGTYGEHPTYPNKIVDLDTVGTDPALHRGAAEFTGAYAAWFNKSFYGKVARLEPGPGYIAPPLDGVWATAPYFHNGSVPTLAAVLDPASRPARWQRLRRPADYDLTQVGWRTAPAPDGADSAAVYDTSWPGYSNRGHTFAEVFDADQRRAVLEYLKSL